LTNIFFVDKHFDFAKIGKISSLKAKY